MDSSVLVISGWAHGIDAIAPLGDALSDNFDVELRTGAQVLRERTVPDADFIVTGSMGGLLAIELLPATCRKLVLISSTAKFCSCNDYPYGTHEKILRRMIVQLNREPESVLDEFFRNVHHPFRESRRSILLRRESMACLAEATRQDAASTLSELVKGLEYLLYSDVRDRVPLISIPVLLLHGKEDRIIPADASEWLHEQLPNSLLKLIKGDGHALPAHHFQTVVQSIRSFLQTD